MTQTIHLDPKQVPARLLGTYTGRKLKARVADSVTLMDTSWSGGTRSTYLAVELATGRAASLPGNPDPVQFGGNQEGKSIDLKPGFMIREHSIFCGKDMGLTFHLLDVDAQKFLPAEEELTKPEKIVLAATAGLKASYGGIKNFRFVEASKDTGIELADWEAAKAALIERKLLNRAGAITVTGRNAIGDTRLSHMYRPDRFGPR